jgi:hypothetical protein
MKLYHGNMDCAYMSGGIFLKALRCERRAGRERKLFLIK